MSLIFITFKISAVTMTILRTGGSGAHTASVHRGCQNQRQIQVFPVCFNTVKDAYQAGLCHLKFQALHSNELVLFDALMFCACKQAQVTVKFSLQIHPTHKQELL